MKYSGSKLREICLQLVRAESEEKVVEILEKDKLWEKNSEWKLYGGKENNYSQIGNQQSEPDAALTEKLTNAVDAVLMRECLKRDRDPEGENAPQSVTEAVENFFDIEDGFLYNISAKKRTKLAQNIGLVATGARSKPNYIVFDKGEGQHPEDFSNTFLSLEESNKLKIPFVQGQFNMGGSGALRFCGDRNIQLLISRRNPGITDKESEWGFTVVRRVDPEGNRKNSVFQYLTLDGEIPKFGAESLPVLPGEDDEEAYGEPLKAGSYLKMYDYNMKGYKTNILFDLYNRISLMLPQIAVPIRFYERRDYKGHSLETTMSGLNVRLEEDRRENLVEGFPSSATFSVEGNEFKAKIFAFKKDLESGESQAEKYRRTEGIIFTKTGQTHGNLHKRFFSRNAVGMSYLKDSLFVIVNCDDISGRAREDLFMNSRDRLSEGDLKDKIEEELEDLLSEHQGLKELRNERRQKEMEKKVEESEALENILDDFLNKSPTLESLFVQGDSLSNPFDIRENEGEEEDFDGEKRPTYFRLESERYRNKECPINKRCRIKFETDVENQYFDREHLPGEFILKRDGEEVSDHSLNLWNGIANLNIDLPEDAEVGDEYNYRAVIEDPVKHEPFEEKFKVKVTEKQKKNKGGNKNRKNPSNDEEGDDGNMPSGLSLPNIREVTKEEWDEEGFNKHTALNIVHTGEGDVYDFYVNMDNIHLHNEVKQNSKSEAELLKAQYKFSMVLIGLSLIRDYHEEEEEDKERDIEEEVRNVTKAVSPVVIPMITELEDLVDS